MFWRLEEPHVPGREISRASLHPGPRKGLCSCSLRSSQAPPGNFTISALQSPKVETVGQLSAHARPGLLGVRAPISCPCHQNQRPELLGSTPRQPDVSLLHTCPPSISLCTQPAPGRTSHPADQQQKEAPGRELASLQVLRLISVTWAWDELGAPHVAVPPGSEGGRRRRKQSSLGGEQRVHRQKQKRVQDDQDLSQWLSTLGYGAVSGDGSGYHNGGAPGTSGHRGMLFNFSHARDSPPCQRTV